MSDWLLLYLFTRLDAIGASLWSIWAIGCLATVLIVARAIYCAHVVPEAWNSPCFKLPAELAKAQAPAMKRLAIKVAAAWVVLGIALALIPSRQDMAIIVGGKIALDVGRSDTAKEVGQEVLDAIRAQLRKAAEK